MSARRHLAAALALATTLTACQSGSDQDASTAPSALASPTQTVSEEPTAPPAAIGERCIDDASLTTYEAGDAPSLWTCADVVVVHGADGPADVAAALAAALDGLALATTEPGPTATSDDATSDDATPDTAPDAATPDPAPVDLVAATVRRLAPERVIALAPPGTVSAGGVTTLEGPQDAFGASLFAVYQLKATHAVVVAEDDAEGRVAGAATAIAQGLPLVVVPTDLGADEIGRLSASTLEELTLVSVAADAAAIEAALLGRGLPPGPPTDAPTAEPSASHSAAPTVAGETASATDAPTASPSASAAQPTFNPRIRRLPVNGVAGALRSLAPTDPTVAWLVDADDSQGLLATLPTAILAGHTVVAVPGGDPFADTRAANTLATLVEQDVTIALGPGEKIAAAVGDDFERILAAVQAGNELPGGGYTLAGKRFVAMYGTPQTGSLGVLGEQSLDATVQRARDLAAPYDDGTLTIVPTFEMIVTVASASATEDGDYSYGISHDLIREWVDRAAVEGFQVILDLQSGRTDFLTQARELEEFLVQPHVGLALDPEWRLKPDQVHLRQIGSVTGEEVNTVVDYLVELTHQYDLPQKMLVLHQFNLSMIRGRDQIRTPDELLVNLHMDGQGSLGAKYGTYNTLFGAGEPQAQGMLAGWKNFFDEDSPMANPAQVLALEPQPVFISFQ